MQSLITKSSNQMLVARWLLTCCALVFAMVILGGVTRLTGSGLSMVDWRPIMGIIPPISVDEWQMTFDMYKKSPEFIVKNYDMDLEGFKGIFWLEYLHRVLGRLIGIVFFIGGAAADMYIKRSSIFSNSSYSVFMIYNNLFQYKNLLC